MRREREKNYISDYKCSVQIIILISNVCTQRQLSCVSMFPIQCERECAPAVVVIYGRTNINIGFFRPPPPPLSLSFYEYFYMSNYIFPSTLNRLLCGGAPLVTFNSQSPIMLQSPNIDERMFFLFCFFLSSLSRSRHFNV